ncbi:MAG TPA: carbon-nitrogen hydrolase family protein [Rhodospirillaceae bacterium]|nr:carbon-nitrogen hydrolase family protein [Magnetovibrio sp.]HBT42740.1 carbon-nitrogen hydrolase family protein [Rhodospirillaceae bacterium]HCS68630.1 carbon-nitrogen hydrolase family protein [Rhodospirillaceae bacterium]|tara:strand:- start:795 stop:1772 length:978 start_codon:yes stop_codon:yes gene_type:complete
MTPFAIAGVQMHIAATHENVTAMAHKIDQVAARFPWVQMVVFSELAAFGPLPSNHPENLDATLETFKNLARQYQIWLLPGTLFMRRADGKLYNVAPVIDPSGTVVAEYAKMFPFTPYEAGVEAGREFCVFDVPDVGRFGLSICYDIWFPETTRQLAAMGAEVLLHPVLTGTIDRDIELAIAQSTAAMFQCYIFDINGLAGGGTGRSCVVDPGGTVLYQAAGQDEIIPVEVDLALVRRQRAVGIRGLGQTLKSFRDHRHEFPVYGYEGFDDTYLQSLGPLEMQPKNSKAGIDAPPPAAIMPLAGNEAAPAPAPAVGVVPLIIEGGG